MASLKDFGGTVTPLLGMAVPDIFAQDHYFFCLQSALTHAPDPFILKSCSKTLSFASRLNLSTYLFLKLNNKQLK